MSFLFGRNKKSTIPKNASFRITQQGSEQVQKYSGDAKSRILLALETQGTLNLEEIAQYSHLNKGQAERLIPVLAGGGYIALASTVAAEE
jgi:hypothetical protein